MDLKKRLAALDRIYAVYDEFAAGLDLACQKTCAHCCTANVTLTTLEGYKIVDHLVSADRMDLTDKLKSAGGATRFRPLITTNRLAELCAADAKVPEEETTTQGGKCCLLAKELCAVYDLRPFGCRCLVSRKDCAETGYADIDDFTISVNTVFLQTIEHLDSAGCSGNLIDILRVMASENHRQAYANDELACDDCNLIANWALKVLMIPPEHRTKMEPILAQLRKIRI